MNADAFRQFYEYHFAENRKIWDATLSLPQEQFTQPFDYSHGSVRNQIVHLINCDNYWFSYLRGIESADQNPPDFEDRSVIRAHWDTVEQTMRDYLAAVQDEMLFQHPFTEGEDQALTLWQVLLHVGNHGTDHRAQILRLLKDLGGKTTDQDYIFYIFNNL